MLHVQIEELQTTNQLITFPRRRRLHDTVELQTSHLLGTRSGSSSPISNVIFRNICERKNIPWPEHCTAMNPCSQATVLARHTSEHTHVHTHIPVGIPAQKHHPPDLKLYMRKRGTVLSQGERERERKRERGGEREKGRECYNCCTNKKNRLRWGERRGESVLLAHFHSGSCRTLQENSTPRPAPLSQSPGLS